MPPKNREDQRSLVVSNSYSLKVFNCLIFELNLRKFGGTAPHTVAAVGGVGVSGAEMAGADGQSMPGAIALWCSAQRRNPQT